MQKFSGLATVLVIFFIVVFTAITITKESKRKIEDSMAAVNEGEIDVTKRAESIDTSTREVGSYLSVCGTECNPSEDQCLSGMSCVAITLSQEISREKIYKCALDVCIDNPSLCEGSLCLENSYSQSKACGQVDYDDNGVINVVDFSLFARWYSTDCRSEECARNDLSGDGSVGVADLQQFADLFGQGECS